MTSRLRLSLDSLCTGPPSSFLPLLTEGTSPFRCPSWARSGPVPDKLIVLDMYENHELVQTFHLESSVYKLMGRNSSVCKIRLVGSTISRVHACIVNHQNGGVYVIDLDSCHGTYLNGRRLLPYQPTLLNHGARLRCGFSSKTFLFHTSPTLTAISATCVAKCSVQTLCDDVSEEEADFDRQVAYNTLLNKFISYRKDLLQGREGAEASASAEARSLETETSSKDLSSELISSTYSKLSFTERTESSNLQEEDITRSKVWFTESEPTIIPAAVSKENVEARGVTDDGPSLDAPMLESPTPTLSELGCSFRFSQSRLPCSPKPGSKHTRSPEAMASEGRRCRPKILKRGLSLPIANSPTYLGESNGFASFSEDVRMSGEGWRASLNAEITKSGKSVEEMPQQISFQGHRKQLSRRPSLGDCSIPGSSQSRSDLYPVDFPAMGRCNSFPPTGLRPSLSISVATIPTCGSGSAMALDASKDRLSPSNPLVSVSNDVSH